MRAIYLFILLQLLFVNSNAQQQNAISQELDNKRVQLPNGWQLSPAGRMLPLGDLPLNLAVSRTQRLLAVTNNGQSVQSIQLIDPATETILHSVIIPTSWYGLKFSADEKSLYVSGGNDNKILKYQIERNRLLLTDSIVLGTKWPNRISPAGIEVDDAAGIMYVVTKEDNSLYIIDLSSKKTIEKISLEHEAYTCLLSPDKKQLYISSWGGDNVIVVDTKNRKIVQRIPVGDNPNELLLNKAGSLLYVATANDNSVSVIDINQQKVIEILNTALYTNAPTGSTANGLALSSNEKKLYVANADNNCLAVFDVSIKSKTTSKGFIPVGWYPSNVKVIGSKIFVANGKGFSSFANPTGPNPTKPSEMVEHHVGDTSVKVRSGYIGGLMKGTLSIIDEPSSSTLEIYSKAVYTNTAYTKEKELMASGEVGNPIPMKVGDSSPIKYVFYVIKENRTYDQVLADVAGGNGDTSLLLFGKNITPNQHKLATEFVLLDNFYADGEVSADGHNWTTSANTTDYLEKNWVTSYGGRGGTYPGEGKKAVANPAKGFIWDYCKRAGITYRTYGEFADNGKANIPALEGNFCPYYESYNMRVRDTTRFYQWKREFDSLLAINAVAQFNTVRFGNNHTEGQRTGRPTPFAHVADNDLAVGMFVEHLSKSSIWKNCAVLIVEDDAQNGADHVDAHRTTAFLAGPFVKRGYIDHTMYSTSSMLRTMELILGLPPMSQYDAAATPMWRSFTANANYSPFTALPVSVDLNEVNKNNTESAKISNKLDFSKEDTIPDMVLSTIVWKAVKGEDSQMPAPRRSAFVKVADADDNEDSKNELKNK